MSQPFESPARDPRLQQVLDRSANDPRFRARLLAEPHAAIRDAFAVEIPAEFRIRFVERGPDVDALIVLPNPVAPRADADAEELDDAALESVAGGWQWGAGGSTGGDSSTTPTNSQWWRNSTW